MLLISIPNIFCDITILMPHRIGGTCLRYAFDLVIGKSNVAGLRIIQVEIIFKSPGTCVN